MIWLSPINSWIRSRETGVPLDLPFLCFYVKEECVYNLWNGVTSIWWSGNSNPGHLTHNFLFRRAVSPLSRRAGPFRKTTVTLANSCLKSFIEALKFIRELKLAVWASRYFDQKAFRTLELCTNLRDYYLIYAQKLIILVLLARSKDLSQIPSLKNKKVIFFERCISSLQMVDLYVWLMPLLHHHHLRQMIDYLAGGGRGVVGEHRTGTPKTRAVLLPIVASTSLAAKPGQQFPLRTIGDSNERRRLKAYLPLWAPLRHQILREIL